MNINNSTTELLSASVVSLVVLGIGVALDRQFGCFHFMRSGAVLVFIAIVIAALRDFQIKAYTSEYLDEKILALEMASDLNEANQSISLRKKTITSMKGILLASEREFEKSFDKAVKNTVSLNSDLRERARVARSNIEKYKRELEQHEVEYQRSKLELKELRRRLVAKKKRVEITNKKRETDSRSTHLGEIFAGCLGTAVWAYGDLLLAKNGCLPL